MSEIPNISANAIPNINNLGGPSIIPTINPPVVQQTPQALIRSLEVPVFRFTDPSIKYPTLRVPTQEEFDAAVRAEKKAQEDEKQEKSRGLPDSPPPILPPQIQQVLPQEDKSNEDAILPVNTNLGVPVIEVPIIGEVPIPPKEQVILAGTTATASVAAALIGKSLVEWMVGKMKPIIQQILIRGKKLLNRDLTQYELQLYFTAELDKKNLKLLKKEWKEEKKSQYKKAHDK
mgnify:CR=1 FL=1